MSLKIEVFYSFQSPYSYLALEPLYELEAHYDIELLWQPFSARVAGQQLPAVPVLPEKFSYVLEDLKRSAIELNVPFKIPETWPASEFDPNRITRGAVVANDMGVLKEYNYKVFNKCWGVGEDPNEENFLTELAEELDIDLADFLSRLSSTDTRERVKGIYKRGRSLGVFDTPTMLIDKERLVGLDKVAYLEKRLTNMGLKLK